MVDIIDQVMMVIIAGGHGSSVGMPGMAKTTLCATIAKVLDMDFKRVQFHPRLDAHRHHRHRGFGTRSRNRQENLPLHQRGRSTNTLADEINRTPPKPRHPAGSHAGKIGIVGNQTYKPDAPFFVLATQNPIEQEGTYPLPEAQQDRFCSTCGLTILKRMSEETVVKATTVAKRGRASESYLRERTVAASRGCT